MTDAPSTRGGTVDVRPMRPDEHGEVGALIVAAYDRTGAFPPDYRAFIGDPGRWVDGVTETFVAEAGGRILGAVAFTTSGDEEFEGLGAGDCGFRFLAVAADAEGAGVGRALVEACVRAGRERGLGRLTIHSVTFMSRAHRLYERLGFERRPDLDVRFPGGVVGLAFTRDLVPDADERFPPPGPVPDEPPWWDQAGPAR